MRCTAIITVITLLVSKIYSYVHSTSREWLDAFNAIYFSVWTIQGVKQKGSNGYWIKKQIEQFRIQPLEFTFSISFILQFKSMEVVTELLINWYPFVNPLVIHPSTLCYTPINPLSILSCRVYCVNFLPVSIEYHIATLTIANIITLCELLVQKIMLPHRQAPVFG